MARQFSVHLHASIINMLLVYLELAEDVRLDVSSLAVPCTQVFAGSDRFERICQKQKDALDTQLLNAF